MYVYICILLALAGRGTDNNLIPPEAYLKTAERLAGRFVRRELLPQQRPGGEDSKNQGALIQGLLFWLLLRALKVSLGTV